MARSYRKVNTAIERMRAALGALTAADGADGRSYAFACGYAQYALETALLELDGYGNGEPSTAFLEGYNAVDDLQEPLPFGEATDGV